MREPWRHLGYPAVVAHRGYAAHYPENTVLALAAAVAGGVRCLEFDVQLTRDSVPVMLHDPDLKRVAGLGDSVIDMSWEELRRVRVGEPGRFDSRFAHVPVATLHETLAHIARWPRTLSFVEIKRHSTERHGVEHTVDRVLETLADAKWPYVLISFVADVVDYAQRRGCPASGWVVRAFDDAHRRRLAELAPDYVFCNADKIPDAETLWPGDWHWVVYEIVAPAAAAHWRERGAAMVESMAPVELLRQPPFATGPR